MESALSRNLPGIFNPTLLSGRRIVALSKFIRPIHPKTEILPNAQTIGRLLRSGWVGQLKIHGHRVQIHLPDDPAIPPIFYTRHGGLHKLKPSKAMVSEIFRVFGPVKGKGWTVIDGEWLKPKKKIFVFDLLKKEGELLHKLTYEQRFALLPKRYLSPHLQSLPLLKSLESCLEGLEDSNPIIEGLVFRALKTPGFKDTSIVRCRKQSSRPTYRS